MVNAFPTATQDPTIRNRLDAKDSPTMNLLSHVMFAGGGAFATSAFLAATYPIALMMKTNRSFFTYMSDTAAKYVALSGGALGLYTSVVGHQHLREIKAARDEFRKGVQQSLIADLKMEAPVAEQKAAAFCTQFFQEIDQQPELTQEQVIAKYEAALKIVMFSYLTEHKTPSYKQAPIGQLGMDEGKAHQTTSELNASSHVSDKENDLALIQSLIKELNLSQAQAKEFIERLKAKMDTEFSKNPNASDEEAIKISLTVIEKAYEELKKISPSASSNSPSDLKQTTDSSVTQAAHQGQVAKLPEKALA